MLSHEREHVEKVLSYSVGMSPGQKEEGFNDTYWNMHTATATLLAAGSTVEVVG